MTKQTKLLILLFCIVKLALHLVADGNSGFQGDELLHIETGKHLAFGFMEFPPFIALMAFFQNLFQSDSVFIHHIFSHVASLLIMVFTAKTTLELGGKNKAVFLVLLAILIAPSFYRSQQLFQPVVFSQLFWVLSFYQLVRFAKHLDRKSLWYLTLFCTLAFLSKYDSIFFLFGLSSLLFFKSTRTALIQHRFWVNIVVFIVCIIPNFIWQFSNDFPMLQMMDRLYETQLDHITRTDNIINLLIGINPIVSFILLIPALIYLIKSRKNQVVQLLFVAITLSFALLLYKNGKAYYFYPIILTVLPFGGLFWEAKIANRKWLIYPVSTLLVLGAVLIPFGMPVYSFELYQDHVYPFEAKTIEGGTHGIKYDEYYTRDKWQTTMQTLATVYDSLPNTEKRHTLIWGKHYGQAGAVNLFGPTYDLPHAFSYHGSFYSWAPEGPMPETVIALSYQVGDFFTPYFGEVILVDSIYNPYSYNEEELYQRIYICKKPKQDFTELKALFKHRIFE